MKLSVEDFFSKCEQIQFTEILNGKLYFLYKRNFSKENIPQNCKIYSTQIIPSYSFPIGYQIISWNQFFTAVAKLYLTKEP